MKKVLLSLALVGGYSLSTAQTLVSTLPQNRTVVLEKFTGVDCGACPGGDAKIHDLEEQYGDDFLAIAVHSFNESTYNIPEGESIQQTAIATGFPAGSVNRIAYEGLVQNDGGTAMGTVNWDAKVAEVLEMSSPVNIGAEVYYKVEDNKLVINTEAYYTADSEEEVNYLNVFILQSKIYGPQAGGGAGDNYEHNHMLKALVTPQWGEEINTTSSGTLVDRKYEWEIPADVNGVPVDPNELTVAIFIGGKEKRDVYTGVEVVPVVAVDNAVNPSAQSVTTSYCTNEIIPTFKIQNFGNEDLTDLTINYDINGTEYSQPWEGNLATFESEIVELPVLNFDVMDMNTLTININNPNDEVADNNEVVYVFEKAPASHTFIEMELKLDGHGAGVSWFIQDAEDEVLYQGGPYEDGNIDVITESFLLDDEGCYKFIIQAMDGNGLAGGQEEEDGTVYPAGYITLTDGAGQELTSQVDFGDVLNKPFSVDMNSVSVVENLSSEFSMYPNPAGSAAVVEFNMESGNDVELSLVNAFGQVVKTFHNGYLAAGSQQLNLDLNNVTNGMYFVTVKQGANTVTKKLSVLK